MAVTVAGDWLLPIAVMNRRFFLKSGTLAVAAAAAPRAAQAKPKGKTLDPADPANMVVPSAKLDIERTPPKSVTLTPFRLMVDTVSLEANCHLIKNSADGGTLMFKGDQNSLRITYPTPPPSMHGHHLWVRLWGILPSPMGVRWAFMRPNRPGPWRRFYSEFEPKDNAIEFEVPSAPFKTSRTSCQC